MTEKEKTNIIEQRKICNQFAMQYYHFCKTLYNAFGRDQALELAREAIFNLSCERAGKMRAKAEAEGLPLTLESFEKVSDLPRNGWFKWSEDMGGLWCPYAEVWVSYYEESPWFKEFASQYCDVIDTTNIEVFSGTLSHKITHNLAWGGKDCRPCEREYFPSEEVAQGKLTYQK